MECLIAHHGYCFDGAASAAVFTRFFRDTQPNASATTFTYRGLLYEPSAPPPESYLRAGAVNAILDYRYTTSPALTWYFDHHVSAFQGAGAEAHFRADRSGRKFHDGSYGSCTKLVIDVARERFGWHAPDLDELVAWADLIDAARFPDADSASSFEPPAMQIAAVLQEQGDDALLRTLVPLLATRPLAEVAALPLITERLGAIVRRHDAVAKRMADKGEQRGDVACFDLSDAPVETVVKFVGYKLFPTAQYAITLQRNPKRVKLSVGFNPWAKRPRRHHIASLCERYGGGGHPVVGAIAFPPNELHRARRVMEELVAVLNG